MENRMKPYTEDFYAARRKDNIRSSARVIVPLVLELVQPRSVVDVGCGTGEWLSVFEEHGVEDVWGVDGGCANTFVESLTRLGPVVLFSAAIPHQDGANHINCQWPEYWAERFDEKDYVVIDCLRRKIWRNENVAKSYRQNILMFAAREHLEGLPSLSEEYTQCGTSQLSVVLPERYLEKAKQLRLEKRRRSQISKLMKRNSELKAQVSRLKKRDARLRARYSSRRSGLAEVVAEKGLRITELLRSLKRWITA